MRSEPFVVRAADGWKLAGDLLLPDEPRAVAIVGHAMMVDRRTLDRPRGRGLVSHLAARGIAVAWIDLRGHGQSGPRAHEGGDWSYDDLVADVAPLVAFARARLPGLRTACVGHSLFGHVTLAHLTRDPSLPIDALALLACNAPHPGWRLRSRLDKGIFLELMGLIADRLGRLPVRRLGLGSDDEARAYLAQFRAWFRTRDWTARDGFSYAAARPRVRTPVLSIAGAGDRWMAPPDDARGLVASLGGPTRFRVVGRATGLPFDPGHMQLALDERARPVWDELADFVLG